MGIKEKLGILTDAAKYDVACTSSGVDRRGDGTGIGNTELGGICHSFSADGRCISLLKILFTNECIYDCKYCINRKSNDICFPNICSYFHIRLNFLFFQPIIQAVAWIPLQKMTRISKVLSASAAWQMALPNRSFDARIRQYEKKLSQKKRNSDGPDCKYIHMLKN